MVENAPNLKQFATQDARCLLGRLLRGGSGQFVQLLVLSANRFLTVPFFLTAWGVNRYADWLILFVTGQLLSVAALGQHYFYSNEVRRSWAERDVVAMNRAVADGFFFYLCLYTALFGLVLLGGLALDVSAVLNLSVLQRPESLAILMLLTGAFLTQSFTDFLRAPHVAKGEYARSSLFLSLALIGEMAATITALLLGASPLIVAIIVFLCPLVIGGGRMVVDYQRRHADVRLAVRPSPTISRQERLRSFFDFGSSHVADMASLAGPGFILGMLGAPSTLIAQFQLSRNLASVLRMGIRPQARMLSVELARQKWQNDRAGLLRLHRYACFVVGFVAGGGAGVMLASYDVIFTFWTRDTLAPAILLFSLILAQTLGKTVGELPVNILRLTEFARELAWWLLLGVALYLTVGVAAYLTGGVYAMVGTLAVIDWLFLFLGPAWTACRHLRLSAWISYALPAAATALGFVVGAGGVLALRAVLEF